MMWVPGLLPRWPGIQTSQPHGGQGDPGTLYLSGHETKAVMLGEPLEMWAPARRRSGA